MYKNMIHFFFKIYNVMLKIKFIFFIFGINVHCTSLLRMNLIIDFFLFFFRGLCWANEKGD